MDRLTEHDLLALIEGDLPPDRVAIVEAALRADPALVERLRKMKDDRAALGALGASDRAPAGIVDDAIARSGEARFVQVDTGGPVRSLSLTRGSRGRRVQMAVAAVVGLALVGVWVGLMLMVSSPDGQLVARTLPQMENATPVTDGPNDAVGPVAPESVVEAPTVAEIVAPADEPADDSLLGEWMAKMADAEPVVADPPAGLGFDEAARLALEGRLRITIIGDGPGSPALAAGSSTALIDTAPGSTADRWRAELAYRTDAASTDLSRALERLVIEIEARTGHSVVLEPAEGAEADPEAAPSPLADARSILWWGSSSSDWARRMVVRPEVSFAERSGDDR